MINENTLWGKVILNLDRLLNILLRGELGVCLSTRAFIQARTAKPEYRRTRWVKIERFINTLFFTQENHCRSSYLWEYAKKKRWVSENTLL
jgi:hypothetical protein